MYYHETVHHFSTATIPNKQDIFLLLREYVDTGDWQFISVLEKGERIFFSFFMDGHYAMVEVSEIPYLQLNATL
ncbi:hypothetical protein M5X05_29255 [Paenibacillus alvei]|uniref:hypothetical protein n=1 Tax=Paenibacillus alvei TaxID=44250 RepID=UPI0022845C26|nr:hypothetical protein [Paenibacillus alvei]MCY9708252.1 hypothetical protein [Paenibacillus alvei]